MQANINNRPLVGRTTRAGWIAGFVLLLGGACTLIASYFQLWAHLVPPSDSGIDPALLGPGDTKPDVPWNFGPYPHEFLLALPMVLILITLLAWLTPWLAARLAIGVLSLLAICTSVLLLFGLPFAFLAGDSVFHVAYDPGFYVGFVGWTGLVAGTALLYLFPRVGRKVAQRRLALSTGT